MRFVIWTLSLSLVLCAGCGAVDVVASAFEEKPILKSQLEIRQMQTREYDTNDTTTVLKAMLNVLQDDGFMVKQANPELGFFSASKQIDAQDNLAKAWGLFWWGPVAQWRENSLIDCTANITAFGHKTRVRTNFQLTDMNNKGGIEKVRTLDDPKFYQDFFSKVDKGIFIEAEEI